MSEHARLSASGSSIWINCPRSISACDGLPDTTSKYAEEGTLAHEIGELKIRKHFELMPKSTYNSKLRKLKKHELYHEEMLRHTDTYLDVIKEICCDMEDTHVVVEQKLDYSRYAPEGFGTGDCLVMGGDTLHVIDLKYGKGVPVSAEENTQMMLYALGAYTMYSVLYDIKTVEVIVAQPRLDSVSRWSIPIDGLLAWGESIKPIALQAWNGEGEFKAGKHCKWCKISSKCRTRSDHFLELEDWDMKLPPVLTNCEIGSVLKRAQGLLAWVNKLQEHALSEIMAGRDVVGWKVVEGISRRKITDVDTLITNLISLGVPKEELYEQKEVSMTKIQALLDNKKKLEIFEKFITKPAGKPALVPAEDKREGLKNNAKSDFEGV